MSIAPPRRQFGQDDARVWAVLGPTNTGKTHLAIERMLGHETGMIGLPLRLLAREVYDKVARRAGTRNVALVTGEEKIVPDQPRYWVTTVESMPVSVPVDFLAVDEIQLAADHERGHVFTHRMMHARGLLETMFLGADTVRGRLADLVPKCRFEIRPRFSELSYTGPKKLTRLPRRSAIVAFSADRVYAIAELVRRQRGGAAVVMGALSPRTRNAQVALYESGDVDFIVATDAIGMGLNMDVDHVAFASLEKFDGRFHRPLSAAEIGQIAGRAGRYRNDGTFGVTGEAPALEAEQVLEIEEHRFEPLRVLMWRNADLDFASIEALLASLDMPPNTRGLMRPRFAADAAALALMGRDERVTSIARTRPAIERLWEVAQVPDFRKVMIDEHAKLLANIYLHLMEGDGRIPEDWFAAHVNRSDRTDGDIDTLASRLAHMRTWTYAANRADWLGDPPYWQERTRAIEDRLSDALHERLTQRFIDRRTSVLLKRLRQSEDLMAAVSQDGEVLVEGEFVGRLQGLVFVADPRAEGIDGKALRAASDKAVRGEIADRAARITRTEQSGITLSEHGRLIWEGAAIGRLVAGADRLHPRVEVQAGEELETAQRQQVEARLESWTATHIEETLSPLVKLAEAQDIEGLARGIAFRLVEALGQIPRTEVADDISALPQPERAQLRKYGVRFGAFSIFLPALLKPAPAHLILLLRAIHEAHGAAVELPPPPAPGLTSAPADPAVPEWFYPSLGFRLCGPRAVRIDMLERLADAIRPKISARAELGNAYGGPGFVAEADLMSLVGCSGEEFEGLLKSLGFRPHKLRVRKMPETPEAKPGEAAKPESQADAPAEAAAPDASAPAAPDAETPPTTEPVETATPMEAAAETTETAEPAPEVSAEAASEAGAEAPAEDDTEEVVLWRPTRKRAGGDARGGPRRGRGPRGKTRDGAEAKDGSGKPAEERQGDRQGEKQRGKPRNKQRGKPQGKPQDKPGGKPAPRPPREKPIDPDSPFAILSQLKEQKRG